MDTRNQFSDNIPSRSSDEYACIVANAPGELTSAEMHVLDSAHVVIAADGAVRKIPQDKRNVVVVGDFDSISPSIVLSETFTRVNKPCQEECSDIEKCIQHAIDQGIEKIKIVGAIGGRLDHSIVTIAMLVRYHPRLDISLLHNHSQTFACSNLGGASGIYRISTAPDTPLSLIAWGNSSTVTLSGVSWPLERFELFCSSRGVSNRSNGTSVLLQVHSGVVICVINATDDDKEDEIE